MTFTQFLLQAFKIGCIGFGGGNALLPLLEEAFVGENKLSQKNAFNQDIIAASLTPGALPVEIIASLGYRGFGYKGMLGGACMIAIPGILGTILLLTLLSTMQSTVYSAFQYASIAISAFVIYLIIKYAKNTFQESLKISRKFFRRAIIVALFVLFFTCGKTLYSLLGISKTPVICLSTIQVLLLAFTGIFFFKLCSQHKSKTPKTQGITTSSVPYEDILTNLCVWFLFLSALVIPAALIDYHALYYILQGGLSTLLSFGGGDAYLVIADGLFIENGMISEDLFYGTIVPTVNLLPGSILSKTLSAVGLYYGLSLQNSMPAAVLFAVAGIGCSIAISCGVFFIVRLLYEHFAASFLLLTISHYIRPIITGLLGNVMLLLLTQNKGAAGVLSLPAAPILCFTVILAVADYVLSKKCRPFFLLCLNLACVTLFTLLF